MRIGFTTCVELGRCCIEEIISLGGNLACAFTLDDSTATGKSGRVLLDSLCSDAGIPLHKFRNINDPDSLARIASADLDWLFVVGWSQIAGPDLLALPKRGVLGIHPTLLPAGRGRAAIPWAILKGLHTTGATLFKIDEGVDSGPIIDQCSIPIEPRETATSLYEKVKSAHRMLIRNSWESIVAGTVSWKPQNHELATYWPGRKPLDGKLTAAMTVEEADRLVRAVAKPYPGAFLPLETGILRIWRAEPAIDVKDPTLTGDLIRLSDGFLRVLESTLEANCTQLPR